ncbi:MAG: hypothetical protein R3D86_08675 [Emcibacteraceae bacterium]
MEDITSPDVTLDNWQERMKDHFKLLAEKRKESGLPLFALEHGLSKSNLEEISNYLRQRIIQKKKLSPHWLLWTIYAAEKGYNYNGDEYWHSFEETTPAWDSKYRNRVSNWFTKFHKLYNGVFPSGTWAQHFNIISWPITHAVLPRFLQRQFARVLYELRFSLARLNSTEASTIGRLIASNTYNISTRLEQFLQQEELVGRIVLALLHQDQIKGEEPLLPETLKRIVSDLEKTRNAKSWINEASRVVSKNFKGLSHRNPLTQNQPVDKINKLRNNNVKPDIRPDLRIQYKGSGRWDLQVEIPSFKDIAALDVKLSKFLKKTRCQLNGSNGNKPQGWLISGRRIAVLKEWPDPKLPIIKFEKNNGIIDHLLNTECRISSGPNWLFRIGADGIAREISGRIVRPGMEYIFASKYPVENLLTGMQLSNINCLNITTYYFKVPDTVSDNYIQQLLTWKLKVAKTISVSPVGLPGRNWDGEGRSDWLTTEKPCFSIISDHKIQFYEVILNGKESKSIPANIPGKPTFIQLSELPVGKHLLTIRIKGLKGFCDNLEPHEGHLELRIREPQPWVPETTSHAGLIIFTDPYSPMLDTFWQNEVELSVYGPPSRQITPYISLQNSSEEDIFNCQVCAPLNLPLKPEIWKKKFSEFLRKENCEWRYLEATSGRLTIDGADLGQHILRFEHEVRPVRWVIRHDGNNLFIRLVDETVQTEFKSKVYFISMDKPMNVRTINKKQAHTAQRILPPGGLYIAKVGNFTDAVVVSTGLTGEGLDGLGVHPNHGHISDNPKKIIKLLLILRYWKLARIAGFLATARQRQVTNMLMHGLIGIVAGWDWARTEAKLINSSDAVATLSKLQSLIKHKSGFSSVIIRDAPLANEGHRAMRIWFTELAKRYGISSNDNLCKFVFDLANRPQSVTKIYRNDLVNLITQAKSSQTLIRGARLAVLSRSTKLKHGPLLIPGANT